MSEIENICIFIEKHLKLKLGSYAHQISVSFSDSISTKEFLKDKRIIGFFVICYYTPDKLCSFLALETPFEELDPKNRSKLLEQKILPVLPVTENDIIQSMPKEVAIGIKLERITNQQ